MCFCTLERSTLLALMPIAFETYRYPTSSLRRITKKKDTGRRFACFSKQSSGKSLAEPYTWLIARFSAFPSCTTPSRAHGLEPGSLPCSTSPWLVRGPQGPSNSTLRVAHADTPHQCDALRCAATCLRCQLLPLTTEVVTASPSPHVHKHRSTRSLNESPWSPATKRATDPSNITCLGRASVQSPVSKKPNFVSHRHNTNCWTTCSMSKRNKPASRPGFHSCFLLGDKPETFSLVLILGIKEKLVLSIQSKQSDTLERTTTVPSSASFVVVLHREVFSGVSEWCTVPTISLNHGHGFLPDVSFALAVARPCAAYF